MAPQSTIPVAANVLGTIGTVLLCVQLVPQIWYNWRRKSTEGLPGSMMILWAVAAVPLGVYVIVQNFTIAIQVQPQAFGALALVNWGQTLFYASSWRKWTVSIVVTMVAVLFAGIEVLLILLLRPLYLNGLVWPVIFTGAVSGVLCAIGLIPPYLELWKRNGQVVGICWMFLGIDLTGAFLSLLAIVAQEQFDLLGGLLYIIIMVLEGVICISHGVWALRNRNLQKQARAATLDFDDLEQARNANAPEFTPLRAVLKRGKNLDLLPLQEPHLTRLGVETRLEP